MRIVTYRGHESLRIQGSRDSVGKVQNVVFSTGRIAFDLAPAERRAPWICFGVQGKAEADKVTIQPWPKHTVSGASRLYRAVLTKRDRNALVMNFRQSRDTFDANSWVRVRVNVSEERCRVFIAGDRKPAIELDNPFACGTIGIEGSCYIRNLEVIPNES